MKQFTSVTRGLVMAATVVACGRVLSSIWTQYTFWSYLVKNKVNDALSSGCVLIRVTFQASFYLQWQISNVSLTIPATYSTFTKGTDNLCYFLTSSIILHVSPSVMRYEQIRWNQTTHGIGQIGGIVLTSPLDLLLYRDLQLVIGLPVRSLDWQRIWCCVIIFFPFQAIHLRS